MKANVGDVVHVRGVVTEGPDSDGDYKVEFAARSKWLSYVSPDAIVHVEPQPQPLKVGDVVKRNGQPFTIISKVNDVAWLRDELGYITADVDDLERVPDEPEVIVKGIERFPDPPSPYTVNWKPLFG